MFSDGFWLRITWLATGLTVGFIAGLLVVALLADTLQVRLDFAVHILNPPHRLP